jgi:hypothetical protein
MLDEVEETGSLSSTAPVERAESSAILWLKQERCVEITFWIFGGGSDGRHEPVTCLASGGG